MVFCLPCKSQAWSSEHPSNHNSRDLHLKPLVSLELLACSFAPHLGARLCPDCGDPCTMPRPPPNAHSNPSLREGKAAKVDRDGGTEEGWQYDSPQHAAHRERSRHQSREGSVEDGELPRVPVNFSLSASKPVTPQNAQPAAQPGAQPAAQPSAIALQKPSAAPSDKAAPAAAATPTPPGMQSACSGAECNQ